MNTNVQAAFDTADGFYLRHSAHTPDWAEAMIAAAVSLGELAVDMVSQIEDSAHALTVSMIVNGPTLTIENSARSIGRNLQSAWAYWNDPHTSNAYAATRQILYPGLRGAMPFVGGYFALEAGVASTSSLLPTGRIALTAGTPILVPVATEGIAVSSLEPAAAGLFLLAKRQGNSPSSERLLRRKEEELATEKKKENPESTKIEELEAKIRQLTAKNVLELRIARCRRTIDNHPKYTGHPAPAKAVQELADLEAKLKALN